MIDAALEELVYHEAPVASGPESIDWPAVTAAFESAITRTQSQDSIQSHEVLGIKLVDVTLDGAVTLLESLLADQPVEPRRLYFVNSQALNLVSQSDDFRNVLNHADYVFGDGAAVRMAARLHGLRLRANLSGADLIPALLHATADQGYRYYMLGGSHESARRTAQLATQMFPGWELAGFHHGYLHAGNTPAVLHDINQHRPHLLLVGMGSPLQECWIHDHRDLLQVRVCAGVGSLFGVYRAGESQSSASWIRRAGYEWTPALWQRPAKLRQHLWADALLLGRMAWAHGMSALRRRRSQ